jgi:hypothetical protein
MKKASIKRRSAEALREMPEIDFSIYRIRKNPYAARIAREGVELIHLGPSKTSLAEMPEADFRRARVGVNKYARQAAEAASKIQYGKGRPRRGDEVGPTPARTIRLPEAIWKALEREARDHATTVHALLRDLVATHVMKLQSCGRGTRRKRK